MVDPMPVTGSRATQGVVVIAALESGGAETMSHLAPLTPVGATPVNGSGRRAPSHPRFSGESLKKRRR
jgi:hypothetical protein